MAIIGQLHNSIPTIPKSLKALNTCRTPVYSPSDSPPSPLSEVPASVAAVWAKPKIAYGTSLGTKVRCLSIRKCESLVTSELHRPEPLPPQPSGGKPFVPSLAPKLPQSETPHQKYVDARCRCYISVCGDSMVVRTMSDDMLMACCKVWFLQALTDPDIPVRIVCYRTRAHSEPAVYVSWEHMLFAALCSLSAVCSLRLSIVDNML